MTKDEGPLRVTEERASEAVRWRGGEGATKWILELMLQMVMGVLVGVVFALVGALAGSKILDLLGVETVSEEFEEIGWWSREFAERVYRLIIGAIFGFAVGNPIGVALVGRWRGVRGSFGLAFLCSVASGMVALRIFLWPVAERWAALGPFLIIVTPVFAVLGYNLWATWKGDG
jgi:hypothetical protein